MAKESGMEMSVAIMLQVEYSLVLFIILPAEKGHFPAVHSRKWLAR